jgi:hypothetical protein
MRHARPCRMAEPWQDEHRGCDPLTPAARGSRDGAADPVRIAKDWPADAWPCPGGPAKGDITCRLITDREFVTQLLSGRSGACARTDRLGFREDSSPAILAGAWLSMAGRRLSSINVALVTMAELRQCRRSGRARPEARSAAAPLGGAVGAGHSVAAASVGAPGCAVARRANAPI